MKKQLSLIICTYNRLNILKLCLISIENCSHLEEITVLITDNSANDDTQNFFMDYKAQFDIRYIRVPSLGLSFARNESLKMVSTKYLLFIDDDCLLPPLYFKTLMNKLGQSQPMVFTGKVVSHLPFDLQLCLKNVDSSNVKLNDQKPAYLSGNFLGLNASILNIIGPFNVHFGRNKNDYGYGEDTLYEIKIRALGYEIEYISDTYLIHYGKDTTLTDWYKQQFYHAFWQLKVNKEISVSNKRIALDLCLKFVSFLYLPIQHFIMAYPLCALKFQMVGRAGSIAGTIKYLIST